jgi:hypothetical protein
MFRAVIYSNESINVVVSKMFAVVVVDNIVILIQVILLINVSNELFQAVVLLLYFLSNWIPPPNTLVVRSCLRYLSITHSGGILLSPNCYSVTAY